MAVIMVFFMCPLAGSVRFRRRIRSRAEKGDPSLIEFEDVVVADDENVTVWLVNFFSKDFNWSSGAAMTVSPLSQEDFNAYIPANSLIDTDTDSPLLLIVSVMSSTGYQDFVYQIR